MMKEKDAIANKPYRPIYASKSLKKASEFIGETKYYHWYSVYEEYWILKGINPEEAEKKANEYFSNKDNFDYWIEKLELNDDWDLFSRDI
jgi:hypothetical protein